MCACLMDGGLKNTRLGSLELVTTLAQHGAAMFRTCPQLPQTAVRMALGFLATGHDDATWFADPDDNQVRDGLRKGRKVQRGRSE